MFDDFSPSATARESRARFRRSVAAAMAIYGGTSAAVVGATATVHKIVEEKETQIEFAPPPEPEPPPPPPPAPPPRASPQEANARPRAKRPELATPTKISDEKLNESSKPLARAADTGMDGFLDGAPGGTGTAPGGPAAPPPPPKAEPLVLPIESGRNSKPRYSPAAKRKGIEGTVVVTFDVLEDGTVANARIVSGPAELHECVLRIVPSWRFQPAHRGTEKVRYRMKKSVVFRLEDA